MKEAWKGDMGTKGGREGDNEGTTHDAAEL